VFLYGIGLGFLGAFSVVAVRWYKGRKDLEGYKSFITRDLWKSCLKSIGKGAGIVVGMLGFITLLQAITERKPSGNI